MEENKTIRPLFFEDSSPLIKVVGKLCRILNLN